MLRARGPAPDDGAQLRPDLDVADDHHVEPLAAGDLASFRSAALARLSGEAYAVATWVAALSVRPAPGS